MRSTLYLCLSLLCCCCCHGGKATFYKAADSQAISWAGRVLIDNNDNIVLDWPGTTARITLSKGVTFVTSLIEDSTETGTRFAVYLDGGEFVGQKIQTFLTSKGIKNYTLISGSELEEIDGKVTVSLVHTQEARFIRASSQRNITVHGMYGDGTPLNPTSMMASTVSLESSGENTPDSLSFQQAVAAAGRGERRRIDIIGDSVTCGYGAAGNKPCNQSIFTNDHTLTYVHLLCVAFQADCSVEAISGIGVNCSFPEKDPAHPYDCLLQDRTMPQAFEMQLSAKDEIAPHAQDAVAPHAVLINLGTNDLCCGRADNSTHVDYYIASYVDFVEQLALRYNGGKKGGNDEQATPTFFLAAGPMSYTYAEPLKEIIRMIQQRGIIDHSQVLFMDLYTDEEMDGCQGHPSAEQHQHAYIQARQQIADVMGWSYHT